MRKIDYCHGCRGGAQRLHDRRRDVGVGAVVGAVIGGLVGGGKGALIGGVSVPVPACWSARHCATAVASIATAAAASTRLAATNACDSGSRSAAGYASRPPVAGPDCLVSGLHLFVHLTPSGISISTFSPSAR